MSALVIGIGNPLAGDAAAGPAVAGCLAGRPGLTVRVCHQLTPELAAGVAAAERVIFIDAARDGGGVRIRRLDAPGEARAAGSPMTHVLSPGAVVALARALYDRIPPAYLVTIPGLCFGIGAGLSESVLRLMPEAADAVERLLGAPGEAETRRAHAT